MRKLYLFTLLVGFSAFVFGQTFLTEDFSGNQMPPAGWTIDNIANQWSVNSGNEAGGTAPEAKFTWVSGTNTSRLISPAVDLTGLSTVSFMFNHFLDDYSGSGYTLGVATRSGGGTWNNVWTVAPTGDIGPEQVIVPITNGDVGASDFQICVYVSGNTYNLDYWYADNLWLFLPMEIDATLNMVTIPSFMNEPEEVTGTFTNFGTSQITSVNVDWQIDGGDVTSTLIDGLSLDFGESYNFTCNGMIDKPIGTYTLTMTITEVNGSDDQNPADNTLDKIFSFVSHVAERLPMFEEFTSSTCAPCATLNSQFVPWCENHEDEIALLKYQMSWPAPGDPYYTEEGGVRRYYYGVSGVPAVFVNGEYIGFQFSAVQPAFNEAVSMPGLLKANCTHTLNGTDMTIDVTLLPFAAFEDYVLHVAVFEYLTTGNVMNNGETEFENVMMKMVPDAEGTVVNLQDRVPFTLSQTVNLDGTNIEEWEDLGVVIWLQNETSQEVFQSTYSIEDGIFATDAELIDLTVDGTTIADFSPNVYEYTVQLPAGTIETPVIAGVPLDANATTIVVPAFELPGSTTIDVFAEDLSTSNTYTVTFDVSTASIENRVEVVNIYPNPTTGKIFISGAQNSQVKLYNITGALVASYSDFSANIVDMSNLEDGIYFLTVIVDNKTIINKKVNLLK